MSQNELQRVVAELENAAEVSAADRKQRLGAESYGYGYWLGKATAFGEVVELIEAAQAVAPSGGEYVLVPTKPDNSTLEAMWQAWRKQDSIASEKSLRAIYAAMLAAAPASESATEQMRKVIERIKFRLHFIGWPAEAFWNSGTEEAPHWIADWRYEIALIENALHGAPITVPEKPDDTMPRHAITLGVPASDAKGPPIAEMEYEFRICEHCGCNTNASLRRCCDKGTDDDRTSLPAHPIDKAYSIRLRNEMAAASSAAVECNHEPYHGRCVHCDVRFERGVPTYYINATAEQEQAGELPELPEPQEEVYVAGYNDGLLRPAIEDYYTADQMHAFYRKGYDAALLRRAAMVEVTDAVRWARDEFADKEHVARCRGDYALAEYYTRCKDKMAAALEPKE